MLNALPFINEHMENINCISFMMHLLFLLLLHVVSCRFVDFYDALFYVMFVYINALLQLLEDRPNLLD